MNENAPYRVAPSYGLEKCPHCGGLTAAQRSKSVHWACGACGKPVIPGVDATKLDLQATNALLAAAEALDGGREARGSFVFLAFLVMVAAASATGFRLMSFVLGLVALFFLFRALIAAPRYRRLKAALVHIEDARLHAAAILVRERGGYISAKDLAQKTRISVSEAEQLLTRLSVDCGRVDIDADEQMHYRIDTEEPLPSEPPPSAEQSRGP